MLQLTLEKVDQGDKIGGPKTTLLTINTSDCRNPMFFRIDDDSAATQIKELLVNHNYEFIVVDDKR